VNTSDYQFYKTMAAAKVSTTPVNGAFPAGTYTIQSAYDSKCVDINAASTANSAQVQQFTCNGTGAQSFVVSDQGSGWYKILNSNSGKAIDITSASTPTVPTYSSTPTTGRARSASRSCRPIRMIRRPSRSRTRPVANAWISRTGARPTGARCNSGPVRVG
jgi:hypothetical protein